MEHNHNCECVICEEWGGNVPDWQMADDFEQQWELQASDLPDPFDEVMGG